jgi:hypothetical protein
MLDSSVLDIAIGLFLVYLLLALLCSSLNEAVAALLDRRAKSLLVGVRNLLNQGETPGSEPQEGSQRDGNDPRGLAGRLYDHPLIKSLYRPWLFFPERKKPPSFIPPRTFALALFDLCSQESRGKSENADALPVPLTVAELRQAIAESGDLMSPDTRRALLVLLDEAGEDLKAARRAVERWFDDAMERLSGWYQRRAAFFLALYAVGITFALNCDTLLIVDTLSRDSALRNAIVQTAARQVADSKPGEDQPGLEESLRLLDGLGLPLGWRTLRGDQAGSGAAAVANPRAWPKSGSAWLLKIVGLLTTAVAVSAGAPFWFALLKKLLNLRRRLPSEAPAPADGEGAAAS